VSAGAGAGAEARAARRPSRRRRRRRLWAALTGLVVVALVVAFGVLALAGGAPPLAVTVAIHNVGQGALTGLSVYQVDGPGHAVVPTVAPGATVKVAVTADDRFGVSRLDLVDDATGRNYSLPPHRFDRSLRGSIVVEVSRAGQGTTLDGRARSHTDSGADPKGWEPLRAD
jgi:hypothetical protein